MDEHPCVRCGAPALADGYGLCDDCGALWRRKIMRVRLILIMSLTLLALIAVILTKGTAE